MRLEGYLVRKGDSTMEKLNINLENCYGISKLSEELDFSKDNVIAIYARNGLMKTSFTKTFKKIQEDKVDEVKDEVFGIDGTVEVVVDGCTIAPKDIFVINSYEAFYESENVSKLLVDNDIKNKIDSVIKLKDKFLKIMEKYSGLKVVKTSQGKKVYEIESTIIKDFSLQDNSFLINVGELQLYSVEYECADVAYASIFDESVIKKIITPDFQEKIDGFIEKSNVIYSNYSFLEKGKLTLPRLKDVCKALEKDQFFIKGNSLVLDGGAVVRDINCLRETIIQIENKIKETPEFLEIEKLLGDVKGAILKDIIETKPDIIPYLKKENLSNLRKQLWLSYFKAESQKFEELIAVFSDLSREIDNVNFDDSLWQKALEVFEKRFVVPYKMEISNIKGAVIGESIPRIEFLFKNSSKEARMDRNKLEQIDVLSQGEKRALYLLNVIFDIEQRKLSNQKTIFVIDDIADSFDYKNKYAIVEYLCEMAQEENFYLIILSHNFDFYRTICDRINIDSANRLVAEVDSSKIVLVKEKYQKKPFVYWKNNLEIKHVLALIPFMRNIVEYGRDRNLGNIREIDKDYLLLTELLHQKEHTQDITFNDLKVLFKEYLGNDSYKGDVIGNDNVIKGLFEFAETITVENADLEYKIILSMAIRHKAENFMITKIKSYAEQLTWKCRRNLVTGSASEFFEYIALGGNQTRELFNAYAQFGEQEKIKVLSEVNIMTPENIHVNSFMYEPILDMDIVELIGLYNRVKTLSE